MAVRDAALFGESNSTAFLGDVFCEGDESTLLLCSHNGIGEQDCDASETAGVICGGKHVIIFMCVYMAVFE